MANVFVCHDSVAGIRVVLKFPKLRAESLFDCEASARVAQEEVRCWVRVPPHRNVVRLHFATIYMVLSLKSFDSERGVFGTYLNAGLPALALEYGGEHNLSEYLTAFPELANNLRIRILSQIVAAMLHCRKHGLCPHLDLKPQNVIVDTNGCARVTDFGLTRLADMSENNPNRICGTPGYMAPEQWGGVDSCDERTDIFAFGRVIKDVLRYQGERGRADRETAWLLRLADQCQAGLPKDRPQSWDEVRNVIVSYAGSLEKEDDPQPQVDITPWGMGTRATDLLTRAGVFLFYDPSLLQLYSRSSTGMDDRVFQYAIEFVRRMENPGVFAIYRSMWKAVRESSATRLEKGRFVLGMVIGMLKSVPKVIFNLSLGLLAGIGVAARKQTTIDTGMWMIGLFNLLLGGAMVLGDGFRSFGLIIGGIGALIVGVKVLEQAGIVAIRRVERSKVGLLCPNCRTGLQRLHRLFTGTALEFTEGEIRCHHGKICLTCGYVAASPLMCDRKFEIDRVSRIDSVETIYGQVRVKRWKWSKRMIASVPFGTASTSKPLESRWLRVKGKVK